jgi:hypothetical protein
MLAEWDGFANSICGAAERGLRDKNGVALDLDENSDKLMIACTGWVQPGTVLYSREFAPGEVKASKLYLCDSVNHWYYDGIRGLTSSFDETIDLIETVIARLNPTMCCAVGTSGGGYMALTLAAMLGLDRALALSPQTNLRQDWRLAHNDARWDEGIVALHQTLGGRRPHDIKDLINASRNSSEYHVVYALGDELDALHADRLEGCRNTYLYGLDLAEHNSASALSRTRRLTSVIDRFVGHESGSLNAALRAEFGMRPAAGRESAGLSEPLDEAPVDNPLALSSMA